MAFMHGWWVKVGFSWNDLYILWYFSQGEFLCRLCCVVCVCNMIHIFRSNHHENIVLITQPFQSHRLRFLVFQDICHMRLIISKEVRKWNGDIMDRFNPFSKELSFKKVFDVKLQYEISNKVRTGVLLRF